MIVIRHRKLGSVRHSEIEGSDLDIDVPLIEVTRRCRSPRNCAPVKQNKTSNGILDCRKDDAATMPFVHADQFLF